MYGCPIWANSALTHSKKIQIIQNKILKNILNLPWYFDTGEVHRLANIETIDELIRKTTEKFITNSRFLENPLIIDLYD
jgi:hypothetical protein